MHIKRHLMKELPETEEAVAQWCRDIFVAKVSVEIDIKNKIMHII